MSLQKGLIMSAPYLQDSSNNKGTASEYDSGRARLEYCNLRLTIEILDIIR